MDKNYGLFVVNLDLNNKDLINNSFMKKFDSIDDFMSGLKRNKSKLSLYTLEEFFTLLNEDMIDTENKYSQVIQLKK